MNEKILAVIFDMDGLMFDTERLACTAWKAVCTKAGYDITDEVMMDSVGRTELDTAKIMRQQLGEDFPYDKLRKQRVEYAKNHIKCNGIPIKPGLLKLLDYLNEKGIKTAVATSTERCITEENLTSCNLLNRFNCIVCGNEVERGKPEPDIFLLAAQKLHCLPMECIVLEDSFNGIKAAYKAGMRPIMVPDLMAPTQEIRELSHQIFESLEHVVGYIEAEM